MSILMRSGSKIPDKKKDLVTDGFEEVILMEQEKQNIRKMVKSEGGTQEERRKSFIQSIAITKSEIAETRKATSIQTIFGITNSMVGSVALVLPPNILKGGLIMSLILMTLIGFISYKTCTYIVLFQKKGESDLSEVVERILGKKWCRLFCITSSLLLFVAGIIYFMLINSVLYPITKYFFYLAGSSSYANQTTIDFTQWSIQYQAIILIVPYFVLFSLRNLSFIIKLGKIGVFAIFVYGLFIIETFIENIASGNVSKYWDKMTYFSPNFALVAGSFALAFFIHNIICQIMSNNEKQENNQRDLGAGYMLVYIIYALIGTLGSIGILGRLDDLSNANIITDFYSSTDILPVIVEFLFLIQLSTAIPVLNFIARTQFYNLIQGDEEEISGKQFFYYNLVFSICCLTFQILCVSPSIVIGLDGALCGFIIIYMIPFALRIKSQDAANNSTVEEEEAVVFEEVQNYQPPQLVDSDISYGSIDKSTQVKYAESTKIQNHIPMSIFEKAAWVLALIFGFSLGVIQILNIFGI
ncbi:transmembrane amino acid transporter protein (macronuclear) [Tetrahymena thermophila SB210]|uniref:Transmembrane amino acid transporter protein n=1 Tax=Tetrahymena thermophila (strain SB210) TaxID=312017 RepID=I7M1V0_TETTS|nr:transmembrane amino acid transporter protein [Tetrahymena thermophila SB210]EAR97831.1 transmembrane amino acid transporter protein [Tetrahymena thermophila SB210]|eukprot:XP_001018076.1 transmembrane amino acid transporter protein [Tetrahymena thermophila SB210]